MGSLAIAHDGSYMPDVSTEVCSAGFLIYCTITKKEARGSVAEYSAEAGNYRGEILGGIMIQLVLRAASRNLVCAQDPVVNCDNIGVVNHGNSASQPLLEK